jgi:hypothetical protein
MHQTKREKKMAKRFIDTDMWSKKWIRQLDPELKLFWVYLMSRCNHAGIYEVDLELASFQLQVELDEKEILKTFNGNIKVIKENKWFIPKFIEFQYGPLNEKVNAHRSVIAILKKYKLLNKNQELINSSSTVKDKDKYKDKVQVKDNMEERAAKFGREVCAAGIEKTPMVDPKTIDAFIDYWTEPNKSKTKMKFELQNTWDTSRRLSRWINNGFDKPTDEQELFKLDATGNARIGYCTKCGSSDFYDKFKIQKEDSKCCKVKLQPNREKK